MIAFEERCESCAGPTVSAGSVRTCVLCGHEDGALRRPTRVIGGSRRSRSASLRRRYRSPDLDGEPWWTRDRP